ncbi:Inactive rhomboid protein 1 [Acropora cervicornis]|uniref:Inactive rhomboid protein 1 n=1 Tax=Acropora cervicornis TaxID=6130 RepID=A0AAD9V7N5_ACRCE|nr:Inactive rhomboid protein 1 [Acropora cervicornis]
MASAYQPTTIQDEDIDDNERTAFCNPFHSRRHHDFHTAKQDDPMTGEENEEDRHERVNQWLFTRCVSRQDGQTSEAGSIAIPSPAGSELHIPGRTSSLGTTSATQLSRAQSMKKKFIKNAEDFFGLGDCDEQHANLNRKWTQRRKRHYQKRYGALVGFEDEIDGVPQLSKQTTVRGMGSISSYQSSRQHDPNLMRTLSRRESVASLAWKKVKKMKEDPMGDDVINDEVFFSFEPDKTRRTKEKSGFLPGIEEEKPATPEILQDGKDEVEGPPAPEPRAPIRSTRGQRIRDRPPATNANRRQYGKGMVGRLLNRTIKRKRLTSSVKKQIDLLTDHRPFFTYWISFVQTIVLIIDKSQTGTLVPSKVSRTFVENFWIGPNQAGLIKMGAKFAPCMRLDDNLRRVLEEERRIENETGCCVKSDGSGCIQTSQKACSICKKNKERSKDIGKDEYPHMTCEITGRPCCMGNEAKCRIVSKDECDFFNGTYHENATLCSQVDCLSETCGMLDFHRKDKPDQAYRLWMAIFAHAGIIHLACTLIFHFTIMRDLEKMAGWLRLSIIYILSGIGGYLYSAILLPYQAEVGPSGSIFGIIACLFVELFQSWQMIARPLIALAKLFGIVMVLLIIGLLPYVDNFAHMIGFVFGFLLAFIFLPYVSFGEFDRKRKQIQIVVCFVLVSVLFAVGFLVFYIYQGSTCVGCEYLNCIPFTEDFCKPYTRGQYLQPRAS